MQGSFLHILNFPACIVHCFMYCFFCIYCVLLHVLRLTPCIVCCFMSYAWLHVLCAVSRLVLGFMYCVLLHVLCLTPCIVCCVTACAWLHVRVPFHISHFASCMPSLILDIYLVFKIIYPKFLWLTNRYPYFPFLLDIKSLTLLVYIQFSSDSIPLSPTLSLILDISCYFLMIMSNFHLAKLFFHLLCSSFWMFPAIFS